MLEAESCCTVVRSDGRHEEREENFCRGSVSARGVRVGCPTSVAVCCQIALV